ncbi:hypothetical protein Dimus_030371 [Dionaea muscipula]
MSVIHLKKKDVVKSSVKGVAMEFDHIKLASILGIPGNNEICEYIKGVWEESKYTKPLEITMRRRDDVVDAPEEEDEEEEGNQTEFNWEAVIDEATVEGESGSDDQFYDAQVDAEEPVTETLAAPEGVAQDSVLQKETAPPRVDPSGGPSGHIPESVMNKLQDDFEKARADRIQADLEKAQAKNARLLALLQQAQTKPKPWDFHCQIL